VASAYVRFRRDCAWTVRPLSATQAARLAAVAGWTDIRTTAPDLPDGFAGGTIERAALRAYGRLRSFRAGAALLRAIGPLWQLEAVRGPA
jgi:hypothetical protein